MNFSTDIEHNGQLSKYLKIYHSLKYKSAEIVLFIGEYA